MQKPKISLQKLLVKLSIITLIVYLSLFCIAIVTTIGIFIGISHYKTNIENFISEKSGYKITIFEVKTAFNQDYLPELLIKNLQISNPSDITQNLKFNNIGLVLSYRSILNLSIIFNNITIENTKLSIEYLKDGNILINGLNLHNANKTRTNKSKSSFDIENWLLQQQEIKLQNINLSYLDTKNNIPKITLNNINIKILNNIFNNHSINLTIINPNNKNNLITGLKWNGGKLEDYTNWSTGALTIKSYTDHNLFSNEIQEFLPRLGFLNQYNVQTALLAKLKNGYLSSLYANFDLNNFSYLFNQSKDLVNFPNISGKVNIQLNENTKTYTIKAENLKLSTSKGYLINNKQINGFYTIDKKGEISVLNTNLKNLNNILSIIPNTSDISLNGKLNSLKVSWLGNVMHPVDFTLNTQFESIGITSQNKSIPNIDNINGNLLISKESGNLTLNMSQSTLNYPSMFYVPYKISSLDSTINWRINPDKTILFNLLPTIINASDFNAKAYGKYIYKPNTSGYIELYANLDKIPANRVGYYLPKPIDNANQWLQVALIGGYGESATLILKGWLDDFPFQNNKGMFYIDANVDKGRLLYVKGWPTIDNVNGKFMIRNQKIIISTKDAQISKNKITNALVTIPDMTANHSFLTAVGSASGSTQNFLNYLKHTPVNAILSKFPEKLKTSGSGNVEINLMVPFDKPENTTVKGTYFFNNNQLTFSLPIPTFTHTSGSLNFTNKSIQIDNIRGTVFGSSSTLSAYTKNNGVMHFNTSVDNLDYNELVRFYLPDISPIISGNAPTQISVELNTHGLKSLNATSNLKNVNIDAPTPLLKVPGDNSPFKFNLTSKANNDGYAIDFNYNDALIGNGTLNQYGSFTSGKFDLGSKAPSTSNLPSIIKINVKPESFNLSDWAHSINKIIDANTLKSTSRNEANNKHHSKKQENKGQNSYPVDIELQTNNFLINTLSFGKTNAETYITKNWIGFNFNSNKMDGYGVYQINPNKFNLYLYYINIPDLAPSIESSSSKPIIIESSNIDFESTNFQALLDSAKKNAEINSDLQHKLLTAPASTINVKQLFYKGNDVGNLYLAFHSDKSNLVIESSKWIGKYSTTDFNGINYCASCESNLSLVNLNLNLHTSDFGKTLDNFGFNGILDQGSGDITLQSQWSGHINDASIKTMKALIHIKLSNGKFLKVDTGTLLGSIIGIINLQVIVNLAKFNFSSIFSNGYAFDKLVAKAYLYNNQLYLKYLYMTSTLATVGLKGNINLNNNKLDMYLLITPHLGVSVAVGAAIVTVNPIVGIATYVAEMLLKNPVNKLFAFTFRITGTMSNPDIKQIDVTDQITKNLGSAIGK